MTQNGDGLRHRQRGSDLSRIAFLGLSSTAGIYYKIPLILWDHFPDLSQAVDPLGTLRGTTYKLEIYLNCEALYEFNVRI